MAREDLPYLIFRYARLPEAAEQGIVYPFGTDLMCVWG